MCTPGTLNKLFVLKNRVKLGHEPCKYVTAENIKITYMCNKIRNSRAMLTNIKLFPLQFSSFLQS